MNVLEDLERWVQILSAEDLGKFSDWFIEFDHFLWDKQIEANSKSGKLRVLSSEARVDSSGPI